jgi:ArsR family metal-binding transcriptional regulator
MKYEVIITLWSNGMFRSRDRIESDDADSVLEQVEVVMNNMKEKELQEVARIQQIMDDDDIPF